MTIICFIWNSSTKVHQMWITVLDGGDLCCFLFNWFFSLGLRTRWLLGSGGEQLKSQHSEGRRRQFWVWGQLRQLELVTGQSAELQRNPAEEEQRKTRNLPPLDATKLWIMKERHSLLGVKEIVWRKVSFLRPFLISNIGFTSRSELPLFFFWKKVSFTEKNTTVIVSSYQLLETKQKNQNSKYNQLEYFLSTANGRIFKLTHIL